jgi:nicotinamidase-related amidase
MQNDFVRQGAPLEAPDARETIDNHRKLLKRFRDRKHVVVFTRFIAAPGRTLIWNWSAVLALPVCCYCRVSCAAMATSRDRVTRRP